MILATLVQQNMTFFLQTDKFWKYIFLCLKLTLLFALQLI